MYRGQRLNFLSLTTLFSWFLCGYAVKNITVDDNSNQFVYTPSSSWNFGPSCGYCDSKPDSSRARDGTWHDNLYSARDQTVYKAEVKFTGTAVYVFSILNTGGNGLATDISFQIDGENVGHFSQSPSNGNGYQYDTLIFSTQSLSSAEHTLTILNGANLGSQDSLLLLDYIIYSQEESSDSGSGGGSSTRTTSTTSTNKPTKSPSSSAGTGSNQTRTTSTPLLTNSPTQSSPTSFVSTLSSVGPTELPTPPPSEASGSSKSQTPLIAGAVVGAVALLLVIAFGAFLLYRRRRHRRGWKPPEQDIRRVAMPFRVSHPTAEKQPFQKLPSTLDQAETTSRPTHSRTTTVHSINEPVIIGTVPMETALTLAVEVERLREILQLQARGSAPPPPYRTPASDAGS